MRSLDYLLVMSLLVYLVMPGYKAPLTAAMERFVNQVLQLLLMYGDHFRMQ
jgi:hypothetical protein